MDKRLFARLAAAIVGAGALALAVPAPAFASSASVTPNTVALGGKITLHVTCSNATNEKVLAKLVREEGSAHAGAPSADITLKNGSGSATLTIPMGFGTGKQYASVWCPHDNALHPTQTTFTVTPAGAAPSGTGLPDNGAALLVAGAGSLAAAGAVGGFLLRRRRVDAPVS